MPESTSDSSDALVIGEGAKISPDARILPSTRGSRFVIGAHTEIFEFVTIKAVGGTGDIIMGEHCYLNPTCVLYSGNGITMGNYVLLAPGVCLMPTNHSIASRETVIRKQGFMVSKGGIVIEDDVWIGANGTVLDGAYIETGAVIAAGSTVVGRVPKYEIWGGSPAKFIKARD